MGSFTVDGLYRPFTQSEMINTLSVYVSIELSDAMQLASLSVRIFLCVYLGFFGFQVNWNCTDIAFLEDFQIRIDRFIYQRKYTQKGKLKNKRENGSVNLDEKVDLN